MTIDGFNAKNEIMKGQQLYSQMYPQEINHQWHIQSLLQESTSMTNGLLVLDKRNTGTNVQLGIFDIPKLCKLGRIGWIIKLEFNQ